MSEPGYLLSRLKVTRHAMRVALTRGRVSLEKSMSEVLLFMVFDAIVLSTNFYLDFTDFDNDLS